jgi:hypothetical protein
MGEAGLGRLQSFFLRDIGRHLGRSEQRASVSVHGLFGSVSEI